MGEENRHDVWNHLLRGNPVLKRQATDAAIGFLRRHGY